MTPGLKTDAATKLAEAARTPDDNGKLAAMLLAARDAPPDECERRLDEATIWMEGRASASSEDLGGQSAGTSRS